LSAPICRPACQASRRSAPAGCPALQVLYFGVIDILQAYNMTKKVEHLFKSIPHKRNTMSAVDPARYSKRFQKFLKKVFV
jgi:hypothetical protein